MRPLPSGVMVIIADQRGQRDGPTADRKPGRQPQADWPSSTETTWVRPSITGARGTSGKGHGRG